MKINYLKDLFTDESGATAIEYGLIASLIAVAIIAAVHGLGAQLSTTFDNIKQGIANAGQ
ncbi:MAG: Flp family type IVb pilin [Candidatus Liberibacter europaeus]|uniref:Flp family type IVb pilin n=1 Tax=Candidatus Liberibacter europaeus TaxID=744859 RepID=A0A2T4VXI9_9HYPH|nr:Flp family type IVb pilin [Candidatus Liberibacter europaeus]PTL86493.1 MAG: Flp family type IVb pilin [Candidatus Liberibacter europaeus]